jgi:hypothetical protein
MNIKELDVVNIKAFLYELNKEKENIEKNIEILEKELDLRSEIEKKSKDSKEKEVEG